MLTMSALCGANARIWISKLHTGSVSTHKRGGRNVSCRNSQRVHKLSFLSEWDRMDGEVFSANCFLLTEHNFIYLLLVCLFASIFRVLSISDKALKRILLTHRCLSENRHLKLNKLNKMESIKVIYVYSTVYEWEYAEYLSGSVNVRKRHSRLCDRQVADDEDDSIYSIQSISLTCMCWHSSYKTNYTDWTTGT